MSNIIIFNYSNISIGDKLIISQNEISVIDKWKIRFGETFTFLNINGDYFRGRLQKNGHDIYAIVIEKLVKPVESELNIILCQAIPEKERMELIIEKAVELGVKKIIPFKSDKSITLQEREKKQKKAHKWPDIALKAAKQCRRSELTEIDEYTNFDALMKKADDTIGKIILSNNNYFCSLEEGINQVRKYKKIFLMVGPEGGFSRRELIAAKDKGFMIVKSGERVLRTETAAIAVLSVIQYELGDFK